MPGAGPFGNDVAQRQPDQLERGFHRREVAARLDGLAQLHVRRALSALRFNRIYVTCMTKELDAVDQSIIKLLQSNARMSISDIARKVYRSRTAVEARIEKLEEAGVIRGYSVILEPEFGSASRNKAFLIIRHTGAADCEAIWHELRKFKNILECHSLFGHLDLMVKVEYLNLEDLMEIKNFLSNNPKVREAIVSPIIRTWSPEYTQDQLVNAQK